MHLSYCPDIGLRGLAAAGFTLLVACSGERSVEPSIAAAPLPGTVLPLTQLRTGMYRGFQGGLYPGGSNTAPPDHDAAGRLARARLVPVNTNGVVSAAGKYVLLSIGYSNSAQEWCGRVTTSAFPACNGFSFTGQALADPAVERKDLAVFNGSMGGQAADAWDDATDPAYATVASRLRGRSLDPRQVQAVWLKIAHKMPTVPLPAANADAFALVRSGGRIVRALRANYPNLRLVFMSSRTYGGYATTKINPEPYAYESGFSVKWLVEAQIRQRRTGQADSLAGDLDPARGPWIGWGAYLWANGTAGSGPLSWLRADFESDGTHPSTSGERKAGQELLRFFKSSPYASCWFLAGQSC